MGFKDNFWNVSTTFDAEQDNDSEQSRNSIVTSFGEGKLVVAC